MTRELKDALIRNRKPLLWAFGLTAVVVFFLGSSFLSLAHNKLELRKLTRQSARLDQEHEELLLTLDRLEQKDPRLVEKIARTQYNLVKPGETEFRFNAK